MAKLLHDERPYALSVLWCIKVLRICRFHVQLVVRTEVLIIFIHWDFWREVSANISIIAWMNLPGASSTPFTRPVSKAHALLTLRIV